MASLRKFKIRLETTVRLFELVLSFFIIAAVFIGTMDLVKYFSSLYESSFSDAYVLFQNFLGHLLLLVIALELVIMLIKQTPESILELLTLTIARKILISSTNFYELVLGIVALIGIFVIRRFLHVRNLEHEAEKGIIVGAATRIAVLNKALNTFIPEELAETVGGVIVRLAAEIDKPLMVGLTVKIADVGLQVVRMEDGVIEKVKVTRLMDA